MNVPARALGARSERLRTVPAASVQKSALAIGALETDGRALVPSDGGLSAIPDGNRSAVLPDVRTTFAGREWMLSVKGVGAGALPYGALPIDDALTEIAARTIAGESWMGEAPYGAQGAIGAAHALEVTALADERATIHGAHLCPVVAIVEVPDREVRRDAYWYRRHEGPIVQEHRLVPSDVRLFHGNGTALGRDPEGALRGLGVEDTEALDAFVDRYLASGIAALTIYARTARENEGVIEGIDFDDAWLDKDSVLGADGTLFLVDLESLEWMPETRRMSVEQRIRRQIDRNYYELVFGLDAMLDVRDRWLDRASDGRARREAVLARLELALSGDPFVRVAVMDGAVELVVRAPAGREPVRVRFLDRR